MFVRGRSHRVASGGSGCYQCGESGHFARDCLSRGRSRSQNRAVGQQGHQPRNDERRFFDKLTKSQDSSIESVHEAVRLMRASLMFAASDGGPALLYRLNEKSGSSALRKCLEYITSPPLFEEGFLPLLERLAQDDLNKPVYYTPINSIISELYELPFLMSSMRTLISEWIPRGSNAKRIVLAWFLSKISLTNQEARTNSDLISMAGQLADVGCGDHLKTILGGNLTTEVSLSSIRDNQTETPGGRHDNDKEDFRSISIVPTCQEFLSEADPYLPALRDNEQATEASLLDRQFRLLREEILGPSKEALDNPKKQQRDIFYCARPVSVESGVAIRNQKGDLLVGDSDPCIMFTFEMPRWFRVNSMKTTKEKMEYWDKNRRILPRDALVCLERKIKHNEWKPVRFGTIVRRETKDLLSQKPLVGISFVSLKDWDDTVKELSDRSLPPTRLFIVSADLFAHEPILRCLQFMTEVPFKHEIVHVKPSLPADEAPIQIPDNLKAKVDALDPGQRGALDTALKDRVALIQGPPGTGKTFIGVLLAEIFLSTTPHTILIVTFTNHALDDVLEALLDVGITGIVRLGGRSRSEKLSQYNLRELRRSKKVFFSRDQTRRFAQLKEEIEHAKMDVEQLQHVLSRQIGEKWWDTVEAHLKVNDSDSYHQLLVPEEVLKDGRGFPLVEKKGGKITKDHLWKCWLKNKQPSSTLEDRAKGSLWRLSFAERHHKKLEWQHEIYESNRSELILTLKTIKRAQDELKSLQQITDSQILSQAKVIGCTTTKAAMCKSLSGVNAEIVLVEEAAEILEAHVLTSLSPGVKRLVMIGDHKQLRPKCQYYPLTVESNRGYNLNCSLFERLANANPISTLGIQHRMHPDISSIPKLITYNELQDAFTTKSHPLIPGLASRVIFINHSFQEDNQSVNTLECESKTNTHERDIVVQTVQYILKQGCSPNDIVVLTPYLGQMLKLQDALAKYATVLLDEKDIADARNQLRGYDVFTTVTALTRRSGLNPLQKNGIRVATIDNYQGEESKIVVISLVRCNALGQIGFLREPERVNVMLSRARDCEIIIGNRATLEGAQGSLCPLKGGALWRKVFTHLDESKHFFNGLPTICQNHGTQRILTTPEDFKTFCQDGGCTKRCGKSLACGHICPRFCHPGKCTAMCTEMCNKELGCGHHCKSSCHPGDCPKCRVICPDLCYRGHLMRRQCGADTLPDCHRIITWTCPLKHVVCGLCYAGKFGSDCEICVGLEKEEEEQKKREADLNRILTQKQLKLSRLKYDIEGKKEMERHNQEIATIEVELGLAEKELSSFSSIEVEEQQQRKQSRFKYDIEDKKGAKMQGQEPVTTQAELGLPDKELSKFSTVEIKEDKIHCYQLELANNVLSLLKKRNSLSLLQLSKVYKKEFGANITEDVNDESMQLTRSKKKRKLKDIIENLEICDVIDASVSTKKKTRKRRHQPHFVVQLRENISHLAVDLPPPKIQRTEAEQEDVQKEKKTCPCNKRDGSNDVGLGNDSMQPLDALEHTPSIATIENNSVTINQINRQSSDAPATKKPTFTTSDSCGGNFSRILPPLPGQAIQDNAAVAIVINRYISDGPIKADDFLEELFGSTRSNCAAAEALRFMIELELNPGGNLRAPEYSATTDKLTNALCLTAKAIDIKEKYPLQARELAQKALAIMSELHFPKKWINELSAISDTTLAKQNPPLTLNEKKTFIETSAILQQDPDFPPVMKASVLPMIGLDAVKQSLIGMYHRFKLSQEQGDGLAASYNGAFIWSVYLCL
ncbi:hypothetical protein ACHAWX_007679 [Stephanocyclus meneghinianus]